MAVAGFAIGFFALIASSVQATPTLPNGVVLLPIIPIQNQSAYGAIIDVGTPPQRNIILVDTGSSETPGFSAPGSIACAHNQCVAYGTYNNKTSTTARFVSNGYGTSVGPDAMGGLINDTVTLGSATFKQFTVGQQLTFEMPSHLVPGNQYGFLGLAQYCNKNGECPEYNTVLEQLYGRKAVSKKYFSLYLGPPEADASGHILFGGIDKAKQASEPFAVNMTLETEASDESDMVTMSKWTLSLVKNGKVVTTPYSIPSDQQVSLVDSGNPVASFNNDMGQAIFDFYNITEGFYNSPYIVDCAFRRADPRNAATVFFNKGANNITMPLSSFVIQQDDGSCLAYVDGYGYALGAPNIRNMYLGYDVQDRKIYFSQVKYTDGQNIVAA